MPKILDDAQCNPKVFCWFGAIPANDIQEWLRRSGLHLPSDLLELWQLTGGGDVFESETILRPNVSLAPAPTFIAGDDTASTNAGYRSAGLEEHFYVFQIGLFLSAIDLRTMEYVTLRESNGYSITNRFMSLDDWYLRTLRAEFGVRYDLST